MNKIKILLKILVVVIILVFGAIYGIAYIMKDRANGEDVREICTDIWEGPQNVVNLVTAKLSGKMYFDTQKNRKSEKVDIDKILEQQKNIEKQIEKEYSELEYTWRHPYIKVNPYGTTPLSALIKFKTDEPMKVKIEIVDRKGTNMVYNFNEYTVEHEYGISGLYLKGKTKIILWLEDKNNNIKFKEIELQTDYVLNEKISIIPLKNINYKKTNFYIARRKNNAIIFDDYAYIRGIRNTPNKNKIDVSHLKLEDNNYLTTFNLNEIFIENEVGKILKVYKLENFLWHHHALELKNGNILLAVDNKNVGTIEDHIIEIDRVTGKIIKEWDIGDILDINRLYQGMGKGIDWFHMNSFIYDEKDNSLIISGNNQGVIKIDYETGELKWIMAYHKEWGRAGRNGNGQDLNKYLLYATDKEGNRYSLDIQRGEKKIEKFKFPVGQHDLSFVGENQILMFDNRRLTAPVLNKQNIGYSRAVVYEIDEKNMNVKEIWSFGEEIGETMYSETVSSVEANEDIIIGSGNIKGYNGENRGRIIILDRNTKRIKNDIVFISEEKNTSTFYQVNRLK